MDEAMIEAADEPRHQRATIWFDFTGAESNWVARAVAAERERDEARKLLDEISEVVTGNDPPDHPYGIYRCIEALLRERHASWEGWKR